MMMCEVLDLKMGRSSAKHEFRKSWRIVVLTELGIEFVHEVRVWLV